MINKELYTIIFGRPFDTSKSVKSATVQGTEISDSKKALLLQTVREKVYELLAPTVNK